MSWPAYPDTKESGVEWLGDVPTHWDVRQLKWGSPVRRGASPRPIDDPKYFDDEGEWSWVRIADVSASDGILHETSQRLSHLGSSLSVKLDPGSLFVSIAGTVGKPCITNIPACIHDGFVYFPESDLNAKFLFRVFESGECYKGLGKLGTQLNLNTDTIGSIHMPIPSRSEQEAIVDFLDCETAKIDALIGKQEQLIATLREDRTATVTHAVTKGLDPDFELKDSGAEWLGEIPFHWETTRLGWVADKIIDCAHSTPTAFDEGEYTVVRSGSIRDGKYRPEFSFQTDRDTYLERVERGVPAPGDIFFTREAPAGEACLVPGLKNLCLGQRMVLLKINSEAFLPDLVVRAIYSRPVMAYFDVQLNGSTVGNLKMDRIAKTPLPNPPIEEQRRIVAFLNERCEKIDALIAKATEVIETLREYRSALITNAVTGKIDVKRAA